MSGNDYSSFDNLSRLSTDFRQWSNDVADKFDHNIDTLASKVKDTLHSQEWLPDTIRSGDGRSLSQIHAAQNRSVIDSLQDWCLDHQAWSAAAAAFILTGTVMIFGNKLLYSTKKRKARRAGNGARKEIVVVAGSPHDAMTRSIALDLERRGFIVFVTTASVSEERIVKNENREDLLPLTIDLSATDKDQAEIHPSLQHIHSLITKPQSPIAGVPPHLCQLSGLILVPQTSCPSGPVSAISASTWGHIVSSRVLTPILTTRLLLPLLALNKNSSSIVLLSPSMHSSIKGPFSAPEVTTVDGLSSFAKCLRQELRIRQQASPIEVVEMKLGNLDLGPRQQRSNSARTGGELLAWNSQQRATYGEAYLTSVDNQPGRSPSGTVTGSSMRELHFAIFDALQPASKSIFGWRKRKAETVYVGRGARTYALIGSTFPCVLSTWMFGLRAGNNCRPSKPLASEN
ncbi:hypothetical protein KEM56_006359 [Ascosphaera pollenicola]|nr:hypothetical protein KEM56_006359 [Ascosphaera pollenicola]